METPKKELDYKKMAQEFEKAWREERQMREYFERIVTNYQKALHDIQMPHFGPTS